MFEKFGLRKLEVGILTVGGIAATLVMFTNAVLRYAFESSLIWAEEFVRIVFVWTMFFAITTSFARCEHIGFDALMRSTRIGRRLQEILYGVSLACVGGLMAYYGYDYNMMTGDVVLPGTNLPTSVFLLPGIIAGGVWVLIGLYRVGKSTVLLFAGTEPEKKE